MLLFLFFLLSSNQPILSYNIFCDYMGNCSISNSKNSPININLRHKSLYKELNTNETQASWNDTFYLLKLEKQIDGVSNYGLLKNTNYECSGGLWECKDSCCLDGFCGEILFFCLQESEVIKELYLAITIFFITIIFLYWISFFILGCKYKDDLAKTQKEEECFYLGKNKMKPCSTNSGVIDNEKNKNDEIIIKNYGVSDKINIKDIEASEMQRTKQISEVMKLKQLSFAFSSKIENNDN